MKVCLFVLSSDGPAIAAQADAIARDGASVTMIRPVYEAPAPDPWTGPTIKTAMDYLEPADIDAVYADLDERQRKMPSVRLSNGQTLGRWTGGLDTPPAIWIWLTALMPYWHMSVRLMRTLERIVEQEQPDAYDIVEGDIETSWIAKAIDSIFAGRWAHVRTTRPPVAAVERNAGIARRSSAATAPAALDMAALRTNAAGTTAWKTLATTLGQIDQTLAGPFSRHVMLISRGARGTSWLQSRPTGKALLLDEYSERMPDALVDACRAAGARLTIIYEGAEPVFSAENPSYADRYPSFVAEIATETIGRISSSMREPVRDFYETAVAEVCNDPAFQDYFLFSGVNLFSHFEAYVRRSIANLVTLHVTQHEAWRIVAEAIRPDVIVGGRLEAKPWISLAAHGVGTCTASIKLGIGEEMMPSMIAIDDAGRFAHDAYPDAFLVWGEEQVRYLSGRLPEYRGAIVPVGRARTDTFVIEATTQDPHATRRRLNLPADAEIILFGANYRSRYGKWPEQKWGSVCFSRESYVECFRALVATAEAMGGCHVLVKPHPADDLEFIALCVERYGRGHASLLLPSAGLHNVEVIAASDIFVSTVTSMFAEATALGRLSINVWRPDVNLLYERGRWEKYNAISYGVETFEDMSQAITRFLRDPAAYRGEITRILGNMERYFGPTDGGNADLAARSVLECSRPEVNA